MTSLCNEIFARLDGRVIATAESLTGGMIGGVITSVPGASRHYAGGVVSYTNEVKAGVLGVSREKLESLGPVSAPVAEEMAQGVRKLLGADIAVSVTGLAGPDGDEYGNPVGTVFIGCCDETHILSRRYLFSGDRAAIRRQTARAALELMLEHLSE